MNTAMRFTIPVLLLVAVFACATPKEINLPGGETGYSVSCSNARNWDKCFSKASEICGGAGYEIISRQTEGIDSALADRKGIYNNASYAERVMVIKCTQKK